MKFLSIILLVLLFIPTIHFSQNLLINPDAESGNVDGWVDVDKAWVAAAEITPHGGKYFLWPSKGQLPFTQIYQDVNVSSYATSIDAGNSSLTLSGWLANWDQYPHDKATLAIAALDAANNQLMYSSKWNRNPVWTNHIILEKIPKTTRKLRVYLIATRYVGSDNDAYFDDLSLTISNQVAGASVTITSVNGINEIPINGTLKLYASTKNGTDASYTWSSSYDRIVKVDKEGLVTAVSSGVATIQVVGNTTKAIAYYNVVCYTSNFIIFTSPVGEEVWKTNTNVTISWKVVGTVASGTLAWSTNSGSDWTDITTISNTSNKQYSWKTPITDKPLGECYLRFKWTDNESITARFSITPTGAVKVEDDEKLPLGFVLSQNFPNPFNPSTSINYYIPQESKVIISVHDILGQKVSELVNNVMSPGQYNVKWNASNYSSGVYVYKIEAIPSNNSKAFMQIKKMIYLK